MNYYVILFSLNSYWKSQFFNISNFIVAFFLGQPKLKAKQDIEKNEDKSTSKNVVLF